MAISAPGAKLIGIFGAKTAIIGNRKSFGCAYDEKCQAALRPATTRLFHILVATIR